MLVVAVLLAISVVVGKAGNRFGMPALLLFLGVGMVAGVDGFGIHFDSAEAGAVYWHDFFEYHIVFRWCRH